MRVSEVPAFRDYWYPVDYRDKVTSTPAPFRLFDSSYRIWHDAGGLRASAADGGADVLTAERYGLAWVCVGTPVGGIPDLGEADEPEYTIVHEMFEQWAVSAPRVIDNALDVSHLSFVHRATVGDPEAPKMNDLEVGVDGDRLWCRASYRSRVTALQKRNTGITSDFTTRISDVELLAPFTFRAALVYPDTGLVHVLYKTATPVDDHTTLFCQFVARNDNPDAERRAGLADLDRSVQAEDRRILEQMEPEFPIDLTTEIHTRTDRLTVEYRRLLARLAAEGPGARADAEWAVYATAR